ALDTQTATSDILRVISGSRTDVQPVFDAIVRSAIRLLRGYSSALYRIAGDQLELAALTSTNEAGDAALRAAFPQALQSEDPNAQAIRDRAPLNIADAHTDPRWPEAGRAYARARGFRSWVVVPMLRHEEAIGAIGVTRREPGGFTDDEIALLQTFADQAVIAIENARLLSELQARTQELEERNRAVTEALEQQTATSEILRIISSSATDLQPVFETIVENATRLCRGRFGTVHRFDGALIHVAAHYNLTEDAVRALHQIYPMAPGVRGLVGPAIRERRILHVADVQAEEAGVSSRMGPILDFHSQIVVPMLREGVPIGALSIARQEIGLFPTTQVELLKTFADQAVIAIENVRLFTELQASNRELTTALDTQTATSDILRVISRSQTDP